MNRLIILPETTFFSNLQTHVCIPESVHPALHGGREHECASDSGHEREALETRTLDVQVCPPYTVKIHMSLIIAAFHDDINRNSCVIKYSN